MTILDYIATHPGCSGGEIAAALNTPTTAINAELRQLWRGGLVIRTNRSTGGRARKTGGQASYHVNPMPFGCSNPLTHMFNQGSQNMSTINHQKLRELAFALQRMATPQKLLAFRAMLSPSAVLALLDELEHARTTAPAIRLTLHHEIADFCATLEAPGEPETPEAIQQELLQRIDKVFDFFLNQ